MICENCEREVRTAMSHVIHDGPMGLVFSCCSPDAEQSGAAQPCPPSATGSAGARAADETGADSSGRSAGESGSAAEVVQALAFCHRLRDGAARMTRQQFRNCLKRAIGADKDYADGVWISFQNNPAAFLAHRNPQSQSEEVLRVILEITQPPTLTAQRERAGLPNDRTELPPPDTDGSLQPKRPKNL